MTQRVGGRYVRVTGSSYYNMEIALVATFNCFGACLRVLSQFDIAYTEISTYIGAFRCGSCRGL